MEQYALESLRLVLKHYLDLLRLTLVIYLLAVFIFVLFLVGICLTKYGKIRLGPADSRPEYPFFTWIGMLFSAGFGARLVFWGV